MHDVVTLLSGYGLYFLLAESSIAHPVRTWLLGVVPQVQSLISCPFCLGFWTSLGMSTLTGISWWLLPVYAFAGAVVSLGCNQLLNVSEVYVMSHHHNESKD